MVLVMRKHMKSHTFYFELLVIQKSLQIVLMIINLEGGCNTQKKYIHAVTKKVLKVVGVDPDWLKYKRKKVIWVKTSESVS